MIKYALRNLIRSPWRTLLYISVTFLIALSATASLFVYDTAAKAKTETEEHYIFVASLILKRNVKLRDMQYCLEGTDVIAYNVSMSELDCTVIGGEYLLRMPEKTPVDAADASLVWTEDIVSEVVAVENLGLTYPFFTGECTITEGTGITKAGYLGEKTEAVIPWYLAETYGIKIGDQITRRYDLKGYRMSYLSAEVVGIYETSARFPEPEDYPVYIPLSVAELDYLNVIGESHGTLVEEVYIDRADFVLPSRESFASFVLQAKENGLDFGNVDLVFNNRPYDVLLSELDDVRMIALIVAVTVLLTGLGMILFFTVYLCHSRKNERVLLTSLGMERHRIFAIFALEIILMLVFAGVFGFFAGRMVADAVSSYVETTISEKAEISESIQMSGKAEILDDIDPMERKNTLKLSVSEVSFAAPTADVYPIIQPKAGEVGIAKHRYYHVDGYWDPLDIDSQYALRDAERKPTTVIGITDMDALGIRLNREEIDSNLDDAIRIYVSEDFDRSRLIKIDGVDRFYLTPWDHHEMVQIYQFGSPKIVLVNVVIAGTYEENAYVSGEDILLSMADYHKVYHSFSVTDDEFYFERMEIFEN